jgi:hypothetical protein
MPKQVELQPIKFEVKETQDSLVIHYQGRKRRSEAIAILLIMIVFLLIMLVNTFLLLTWYATPRIDDLIFLGFYWLLTLFFLITGPAWVINPLLDRETIKIRGDQIRIEKSGFRSIHWTRIFHLRNKLVFHFTPLSKSNICITFSNSKFKSRLLNVGWVYYSPMRHFCSGISVKDGLAILDQIQAKLPQFEIRKDLDFSMDLKPG